MKKIIAFLILLLCLKQSYAQYPLKQFLGSDSTLVTVRGGMNARVVLWSFTDTTQANTQRISQYAGALIYTTVLDKVWYRNSTATGWIEFTSSGGTTTNIYNSDGFITGTRVLDLSASPLTFSRSGVKQFAAEDNLTTIGSPNNQKRITVYNDSITILGLSQTTDTTTYKPLAIDGNGYFTIMDRWPGGGGSTPTLQQVLTAGSTLTGNNTITGGLYSFKFTNQNLWSVDTARQWRLRSFREADSSMQLIQSSNYGVSGLKRINISSQDTAYLSNIIIDHDHLTNEVYERNPLTLKTAFAQDYNRFSFQGDTTIMAIEANNRRVGIMTDVPDSTFHVVGGLKFVTGRQGAGKVLTSDANGGADWATHSGGSYTFTNGITESGGTVKLGGTLTEAITTIDADGNDLVIKSNSTVLSSSIYLSGQDLDLFANSGGPEPSSIRLKGDSLEFEPLLGRMSIDTLAAASNMTNKRVMTWDTVTKRWEQIAKDSVGGGGSTSPGGSTKQIQYNNAGAFGGAAGFEYQAAASPNILMKGQDKTYIPLIVKGVDSSQTADLFRVSRYEDSAMFRVAANGSVTIGPAYDYANAIHAPGHELRYSNAGYTGGIKIRNHNSGSIVRLQTVNNGLYLTDDGGSAAAMTLGTRTNPADASTFIAASGAWTISAGKFGVGGAATSTVHSQGSFATAYTATATGITLGITHSVVNVTATGQTITLPTAAGITGRQYTIKLTASGSCTIDGNASETIDGAATYSLASQYKYVTIVSDGTNWIVTANN